MKKAALNETIGEKLRREREALGWSQAKLATAAGTTQQTVDRIERGLTAHSRAIPNIESALASGRPSTTEQMQKMRTLIAERRGQHSPLPNREHNFPILVLNRDGSTELLYFSQMPTAWTNTAASYALVIDSDFLMPMFAEGEILYVDYEQPPAASGFVVAFEVALTQAQKVAGEMPPVQVFRLTQETASHYRCETAAGERFDLEKDRWHADPIVSRYTPRIGPVHQPF